jgi:hypothetical protein
MNKIFRVFLILALLTNNSATLVVAQTAIDDFLESPEYRALNHPKKNKKPRKNGKVVINQSEYLSLFDKGMQGAERLIEWLGNPPAEFRRNKIIGRSFPAHIKADCQFQIVGEKEIPPVPMSVLLPKPNAFNNSSYLVITDFASLVPPTLKIDSLEKVSGRFGEGEFYFQKDGQCSLVINLEKGGRINIGPASCELKKKIIDIGNTLDVYRTNFKLRN